MSLDVYLHSAEETEVTCDYCQQSRKTTARLYEANITHNLTKMADEAGIYEALWHPEEINAEETGEKRSIPPSGGSGLLQSLCPSVEDRLIKAGELTPRLRAGLEKLKSNPVHFKRFNPENGWGSYEGLVGFVENYLKACEEHPDAIVSAWR